MTTKVTVLGASGAVVSIPFVTGANAAVAQALADAISRSVLGGTLTQVTFSGGAVPAVESAVGGIVVTVAAGSGAAVVPLPATFLSVVANSPGISAFLGAPGASDATVIAGGSALTYFNQGLGTQAMFGGGANCFVEFSAAASGVVNVDGMAYVGATQGATTVLAFGGSVLNVAGGGHVTVNAQAGTETLFVTGSSTVPVDVDALGSGLMLDASGGAALIAPGAANATIFSSAGGSASVFGATSLTGGSGALTVFASGYYVGGSGGENILATSAVPGATTLVGGAAGDQMFSFAPGNLLASTSGRDLMASFTGADTLVAGAGTASMFGGVAGDNTFVFAGAGTSSAFGAYADASAAANRYVDSTGGATITINDFRSGIDTFVIIGSATITNDAFVGAGAVPHTIVALSNGTTITFNYTTIAAGDVTNV